MKRVGLIMLLGILALLPLGCGSKSQGGALFSGPGEFLYVSNSSSNTIAGFRIDAGSGAITQIAGSPFSSTGRAPGRIATDAQGKLLFVADQQASSFSAYLINNASGALTPGATQTLASPSLDLVVDTTAKSVYVLTATQVWGFRFDNTTGTLTSLPGSPFSTGGLVLARRITLDLAGPFLYVTDSLGIAVFQIASDGSLLLASRFPETDTPVFGIAVHPATRVVYTASPGSAAGQPSGILGFTPGSSGTLTLLSGSPFATNLTFTGELLFVPSGKFLFASGGLSDVGALFGFSVGSTGQLTQVSQSALPASTAVAQLTLAPTGAFLYSANAVLPSARTGGSVSAFSIDANGNLTAVPGSPFTLTLTSPAGIAVTQTGP